MSFSSLLKGFLKFAVAFGLIYWLIDRGMLDLSVFSKVGSPFYMACLLSVFAINLTFVTLRWQRLLNAADVEISFFEAFKLTLIGIFFNFAMPGGVGGDVVKAYYIVQDQPQKRTKSAISVIADRVMGFFSMVLMAIAASLANLDLILANEQLTYLFMGVLALFAGFVAFGIIIFSNSINWIIDRLPLKEKFAKAFEAMQFYTKSPRVLVEAILSSLVAQSAAAVFFMIVAVAMGLDDIPLTSYFFVVPLGMIAMAVPISPAGIGVGQAVFLFLFRSYLQRDVTLGADALTLFQMVMFCYGLIGVIFYLQRKDAGKKVPVHG